MKKVLTLPENTRGRDFVVGDIHGAFDLLDKALREADFDPEKDRLISVGDLIDRGPFPERCLEFLKQPWFFAVKGNHEDLFMEVYKDGVLDEELAAENIRNGMGWVFTMDTETLDDIRAAFSKLPTVIETETSRGTVGFVHADIPSGMDWDTFKQKIEDGDGKTTDIALWSRKRVNASSHEGVDGVGRVFFGHTPQDSGPLRLGNCYYVDTGAVYRGLNVRNAEKYTLTVADIMTKTVAFNGEATRKKKSTNVLTERPDTKQPFGRYVRKRKEP